MMLMERQYSYMEAAWRLLPVIQQRHQALECHGGYTKNGSELLSQMPSFSYYYFTSVANVSNCNQERGKSYMLREVAGCRKPRKHLLLRVALEISSAAELPPS